MSDVIQTEKKLKRMAEKTVFSAKTEDNSDKILKMSIKLGDNRRISSDREAQSGKVLKRKGGKQSGKKGNIPTAESKPGTASSKAVCEIPASEKQPEISTCKTSRKSDSSFSGNQKGTQSGAFVKKSKKSNIAASGKKVSISKNINLRPSDIRFSQSSISSKFKDGTSIGQLLDDIYFGRCFASAVSQIEVSSIEGQWVSADNRRLWVFKQLEKVGRVDFISVKVVKKLYQGKLTSENNGLDVEIRNGRPKGEVYSQLYPETKETKRRGRNRKRRTETSGNTNVYIDHGKNKCPSQLDLEISDDFRCSCIPSDESHFNPQTHLETILHYNQGFVDKDTYFEIYSYSDDEDWAEENYNSDTVYFEDFSEFEHHGYWYGSKNENEVHFPEEEIRSSTISVKESVNNFRSTCSSIPQSEERVKHISTENNFLSKISDGIEVLVDFLNRLFT